MQRWQYALENIITNEIRGMKLIIYDHKIDSESVFFIKVGSKYILDRLIDLLDKISFEEVIFCSEKVAQVGQYIEERGLTERANIQVVNSMGKGPDDFVLRANYIYDEKTLIKLIKKGRATLSSAILWKIENKSDIQKAEQLLIRADWNPIGRYINVKLGKTLAKFLAKTSLQPNQITFLSLIIGLGAGFCLSSANYKFLILGAFLAQVHFILDVADGQLARLKNGISEFGGWLDGIVGKISENSWYIGITYGVFSKYNSTYFLIIGLLVVFGDFMILYNNSLKKTFFKANVSPDYGGGTQKWVIKNGILKRIYWFFEQGDVKLYLITIFAILNRLEIALVYLAFDFNIRWIYKVIKECLLHQSLKAANK